ncbi:MAG: hypothetical protein JWO37_2201 [Acidimicrobiales bacterium]|jgi:hypothetical protein|nr:hypothetical protein [Acidimicrobiales bacterium]
MRDDVRQRIDAGVRWLTVALLTVVGVVPIIGNELRVQNVDPQFMRDIIERVHRFGGTFYDNGIYNKGPLEPIVYDVARHLGGADGMWLVVSAFVALAALACAVAAARTARWTGAPASLALATGAALYLHLTLSPADYAGVLYARNMTVALLAIAWVVTFEDRLWRNPRARLASTLAVGAILGVVVQALVAEAFAAAAVGLALLAMVSVRVAHHERRALQRAAIAGAVGSFAIAPAWYALRGSFASYWASWYGHAHLMNIGTQRSLASQFALGWNRAYSYYQHRPLVFLAIVGFLAFTWVAWPGAGRRQRAMHLGLIGWLAASWLEQILNQRYSSQYFVVNAVPTALMIAVLVGRAGPVVAANPRVRRTVVAWPLIAILGSIYLSGSHGVLEAVKRTSRFTSVHTEVRESADNQGGAVRSARGVLDLVSRDDDPVLAWTIEASAYLDLHRVAAGRFIWKSFLVGEIYLGATGPQYVLPHTWRWFRADLARSRPVAFVKTGDEPARGTPFADLVRDDFRLVYQGHDPVYLRDDVARAVLDPSATAPWRPLGAPDGSGWTVRPDGAGYAQGSVDRGKDALLLSRDSCFRVDGTLATDGVALPAVDFRIDSNSPTGDADIKVERLHLRLDRTKASSASDAVDYESVPSGVTAGDRGPVPFSLIVGRRAAVLVVRGEIRAAMRMVSRSVSVSVLSRGPSLTLADLRSGPAPPGSGC